MSNVLRPVGRADLLGDERFGGFVVRYAQQRLADAQQGDPLFVREPVFLQEQVEQRTFIGPPPTAFNQPPCRP